MKRLEEEKNLAILAELQRIQNKDGTVLAEKVVSYAEKHPTSALYAEFEWDDTEAAKQYRLEQARGIIQRVWITVTGPEAEVHVVRAFHSLHADRAQPGGGYRTLQDIMSDPEKRDQLLQEALADYQQLEEKYDQLVELAPLFAVRKSLAAKYKKQKKGTMTVGASV